MISSVYDIFAYEHDTRDARLKFFPSVSMEPLMPIYSEGPDTSLHGLFIPERYGFVVIAATMTRDQKKDARGIIDEAP